MRLVEDGPDLTDEQVEMFRWSMAQLDAALTNFGESMAGEVLPIEPVEDASKRITINIPRIYGYSKMPRP